MSADDVQTQDIDPTTTATGEEENTDDQMVDDPTYGRKVFVGNLSFRTNFKSLKEGFSKVGTVEKVNVISKNGRRLGFGFVQFATEEGAQKAAEEMNDTELDGREIKVELSRSTKRPRKKAKKAKKPQTENTEPEPRKPKKPKRVRIPIEDRVESKDVVYIRGLAESVDEEALTALFKDFGLVSVTIRSSYRRKDGSKPRFAFVTVDAAEHQQQAVDTLEGKELQGETLVVRKGFEKIPVPEVEPEESVETKEAPAKKKKKPRKRKPRKSNTEGEEPADDASPKEGETDKPKKKRNRKPKKKAAASGDETTETPTGESSETPEATEAPATE